MMCIYGGTEHVAGPRCTNTYSKIICGNQYAGANGGTVTGPGGGSGSGGSSGSSPLPPQGTVTAPVPPHVISNLTLNGDQTEWIYGHPQIRADIEQYLIANNLSSQSKEIAKQFIVQCMNNPDLTLNFNATLKSPFFIDLSSVSGNSPEEIKFKEVYNALMQSPKFKELFINLFGPTPLFNVKFIIENLPQNGSGTLDGICTMISSPNNLDPYNKIRIDRNHLLTKSKVDIALTIIHECIHAYLNIKLRNPTIGISITNINNMDFQACINTYYNGFSGNQTQHAFYVDFMIPTMVEIFLNIKNYIITPSQANALQNPINGGAILYQPLYQPPTTAISNVQVPWNWNAFFSYFSYGGLEQSNSYPFHYPFLTNDDYYHYYYISCFNVIFNP